MIYLKLFMAFSKIGLLGFGGGLAIIALIRDSINEFADITAEQFANMVAITQVTPGPVGINMATFAGYESAGILGSICATLGVAVPAFVIVSLVCHVLFKYMDSWGVKGALAGIRPASIGMIATALVTLTGPAIFSGSHLGAGVLARAGGSFASLGAMLAGAPIDVMSIVIIGLTVILILKFKQSPVKVLLIMGVLGMLLQA